MSVLLDTVVVGGFITINFLEKDYVMVVNPVVQKIPFLPKGFLVSS